MLGGTVMDNLSLSDKGNRQDASLFRALDKGIKDVENGRIVPHDQAMKLVRQRLNNHVRNSRNTGSNQ